VSVKLVPAVGALAGPATVVVVAVNVDAGLIVNVSASEVLVA
jgi:hypothetical protein